MNHLAAFSKVTWGAAVAVVLASACGGNSFSGGDDPKGGEGNGGSQTSGGAGSVAGKASGGKASGGTTSHAGTTSSAGTSVGGGAGGDACSAPPESGNCDAYFERWYHDAATGLCRSFVYGGCGGNENNYQTFEACQQACPGGSPNYDACSKPTDCVIGGGGCCGICDAPEIRARDLMAYNKQYAGLILQCGLAGDAAPGIACVPCPAFPGDGGSLKHFVPNCVQGQCVVEDVRTSSLSLCKTAQDCMLRNGNGCCENCSASQTIAINTSGAFQKLVCGDMPPPCAECEPAPPSNATPYCNAMNHCDVSYAIDVDPNAP